MNNTRLLVILLYFMIPALSYLQFLNIFPSIPLSFLLISCIIIIILSLILRPKRRTSLSLPELLVYLTMFAIIGIQIISFDTISNLGGRAEFERVFALTAISPLILLYAGRIRRYEVSSINNILLFLYAVYSILIIYGSYWSYAINGNIYLYFFKYEDQKLYNYQSLADAYAIISILALYMSRILRSSALYMTISIVTIVLLTLAYSRSSLLAFTLLILFNYILDYINKKQINIKQIAQLTLIVLIVSVASLSLQNDSAEVILSRLMIFSDGEINDSSYIGRAEIFEAELLFIKEYLLLGNFMGDWIRTGYTGAYIHNIVSYISYYGIFVFLPIVTLLATALYRSFAISKYNGSRLETSILFFCTISVITARSVSWPYIWLGLAIALSHHMRQEKGENK